jgi:hypothetical protein
VIAVRLRRLWDEDAQRRFMRPAPRAVVSDQADRDDAKRTEAALDGRRRCRQAPRRDLLASRCLYLPPPSSLDSMLGLDPWLSAGDGRAGDARRGRHAAAIHRTFLARDGAGGAFDRRR